MTKTIIVPSSAFWFWPCKCGHYYGRHAGVLSEFPESGHCGDCDCQKFEGVKPFEEWREEERARNGITTSKTKAIAEAKP